MKGLIFDIKRYSIHDGEGIRTTVFFKGCPLSCLWCHNPESQLLKTQIIRYEEKCIYCKTCVNVCKQNAISINESNFYINERMCNLCLKCTTFCPTNSLTDIGKLYSVSEILEEILKDRIFYGNNGGVTISGGEPYVQFHFLLALLKRIKENHIHVTIDTSGYTKFSYIEKTLDYVDQFLYDLKITDLVLHKKYTGVSNEVILENLEKLSKLAKEKIIIRLPIIPTINDDMNNLLSVCELLNKLELRNIDLLPYHNMMIDKYRRLNMEFKLKHIQKPSEKYIESIANFFRSRNFIVNIGG